MRVVLALLTTIVPALVMASTALTGAASQSPRSDPPPLFTEIAMASGLVFTHQNGAAGAFDLPEIMGAGAALFDYDNDGDLDVFFVQGRSAVAGTALAPQPTSRLFRNELRQPSGASAGLTFTDVTETAGVGLSAQGMGAAVGDYDNDGWLDLFVTTARDDVLYRNRGDGTFGDVTARARVSDPGWSTSATFVDYDRDGWLDLFVASYVDVRQVPAPRCQSASGTPDYCGAKAYRPAPHKIYRNLKNGRFADVTKDMGVSKASSYGLGVIAGDFNGDGWPDVYVANPVIPNQLWMNRRTGGFIDHGPLSGTSGSTSGTPESSIGVTAGDIDRDGDEDLFVTNLAGESHALYVNSGPGLFDDQRARAGLGAATAASTGFGTGWFDYDNDGWLDLLVVNGAVTMVPEQRGEAHPYRMPNQLFRNAGNGRFVETSAAAGSALTAPNVGRGAAFGDIDEDGDLDVVVSTNAGPAKLFRNDTPAGAHWLQVRLDQRPGNRFGMGSWVGVERSGQPTLWRYVRAGGGYLSSSDSRAHFGLGASGTPVSVATEWPDGVVERWTGVAVDNVVSLGRGTGVAVATAAPVLGQPGAGAR